MLIPRIPSEQQINTCYQNDENNELCWNVFLYIILSKHDASGKHIPDRKQQPFETITMILTHACYNKCPERWEMKDNNMHNITRCITPHYSCCGTKLDTTLCMIQHDLWYNMMLVTPPINLTIVWVCEDDCSNLLFSFTMKSLSILGPSMIIFSFIAALKPLAFHWIWIFMTTVKIYLNFKVYNFKVLILKPLWETF